MKKRLKELLALNAMPTADWQSADCHYGEHRSPICVLIYLSQEATDCLKSYEIPRRKLQLQGISTFIPINKTVVTNR